MGIKTYMKDNYSGSEQGALMSLYQKYQGIISSNFYHWENEFKALPYQEQLEKGIVPFIEGKVEQVLADAKKIREEEEAIEKEKENEEEAW